MNEIQGNQSSMLPGSRQLSSFASPQPDAVLRAALKARAAAATHSNDANGQESATSQLEKEVVDDAVHICLYTKKRFKSKEAFDNYKKSKKYQELVKKAEAAEAKRAAVVGDAAPSAGTSAAAAATTAADTSTVEGAGTPRRRRVVYVLPDGSTSTEDSARVARTDRHKGFADRDADEGGATTAATDGGDEDDEDDEGDEDDGWTDDEEAWEARWTESLFDGHTSASFEANVAYMKIAHSFYVPDMGYLVDPHGLFSYLQAKICRHHACIFCQRRFATLEACRDHMRDKAHCRLNFDAESTHLELRAFYNFDRSWLVHRGRAHVDANGEMVLARGVKLGHRSFRRYYRQQYGRDDARLVEMQASPEQASWLDLT